MANFRDPTVVAQDYQITVKLWHTMSGLYIWEFFTTLDYEWSIIRGRRPYRWTILIYSLTRVAALLLVILCIVLIDDMNPINCQAINTCTFVLIILTMLSSSLLIVLRVIAIWNRNRVVVASAIGVWVINAASLLQTSARLHFTWSPIQKTCVPVNAESSTLGLVAMPATDIALLIIMLVGLFRLRCHGGGTFGLAQVLWRQGVIWLLLATAAEIPPLVFNRLNLNAPFNEMFQLPSWVAMAIAGTRMYRSLTDFASRNTDFFNAPGNLQNNPFPVQGSKQINAAPRPINEMDEAVHMGSEQQVTPRTNDDDASVSTNEEIRRELSGFRRDDKV